MHFSSIGMLLEQHKDAILKLLSDPSLLEEQVHLAMKTLKEYVVFCRIFLHMGLFRNVIFFFFNCSLLCRPVSGQL